MQTLKSPSTPQNKPLGIYTSIASNSAKNADSAESAQLEQKRIWREKSVAALEAAGLSSAAFEFGRCGQDFMADVCSANYDHLPRPVPFTCHKRYCPDCAARETARKLARYIPAIYDMVAENAPPTWSLKKFELTTPIPLEKCSPDDYQQKWSQFEEFLRKLIFDVLDDMSLLSKSEKNRGRVDLKRHKIGALAASEFGERGRKLHFHIVFYGPYLAKQKLTDKWHEVTNGECEITWIRAIPVDQVEDQIKEVTKYVTKFTQLPPRLVPVLARVIKGSRTVRSYGLLHGIKKAEKVPCSCELCGAARQRISVLQYLETCEHLNLKIDDELVRVYEGGSPDDLLDLKHGNNSGGRSAWSENKSGYSAQAAPEPEWDWRLKRRWERWHSEARRLHDD